MQGYYDMLQGRAACPVANGGPGPRPDMESAAGPSRAPDDRPDGSPHPAPAQCVAGHQQTLLFGDLWKGDQRCLTLQDILEQTPPASPPGPVHRATRGRRSSERSGDSLGKSADRPAATRERRTHKRPRDRRKAGDPGERVTARALARTCGDEAAEGPASGSWDPGAASAAGAGRAGPPRLLQQVPERARARPSLRARGGARGAPPPADPALQPLRTTLLRPGGAPSEGPGRPARQ